MVYWAKGKGTRDKDIKYPRREKIDRSAGKLKVSP